MFANREEAGRQLAAKVSECRLEDPVVLALPRGGVPIGAEIARVLKAPLDVILVHKIGAPFQPELAIGAVVGGAQPETLVDREAVTMLAVDDHFIKAEAARQLAVIAQREALYRRGRPAEPVTGRTAILVDDGIATGWTMQAAIRAVRRAAPKRIVIAVPVAAPRTVADLRRQVDEVVCVMAPPDLGSIGRFYRDFSQVEDREVVAMLEKQ